MAATKPALASGGITHCRLRWGLRTFFLASFRSCCRWPSRRCSARRPSPRAGANSNGRTPRAPASRSGRSISPPPPFGLYLRVSAAAIPSSTSRRRVRPILLMLVSNAAEIARSLQPSPVSDTSAFSRMRAFVSDCAGCLPAQIIASSCSRSSALSFTTYFLTEISLPATNHLHRRIAATEIQKNTTDSRTLATSSMGRLTLNVLLSFAQFEREVTGERIRDKIAASKRNGLWVGGVVPLGYEVQGKKLIVDPQEAATVRLVFSRYFDLGSLPALQKDLRERGIVTRRRTLSSGRIVGGNFLTNGPLAYLLRNRVYLGEINHLGQSYPGEHEPIVDPGLFESVQAKLSENRRGLRQRRQSSNALLLVH